MQQLIRLLLACTVIAFSASSAAYQSQQQLLPRRQRDAGADQDGSPEQFDDAVEGASGDDCLLLADCAMSAAHASCARNTGAFI